MYAHGAAHIPQPPRALLEMIPHSPIVDSALNIAIAGVDGYDGVAEGAVGESKGEKVVRVQ